MQQAEFEWSSHTQELLLASFYIGYAIMQAPVGWMADTFGGKWLFAAGVIVSAILNIVGPVVLRTSLPLFFATRVVSGMAEVRGDFKSPIKKRLYILRYFKMKLFA